MAMIQSRFVRLEFVALEARLEEARRGVFESMATVLEPKLYHIECGKLQMIDEVLRLCQDIEKKGD
jgi:hypothetical protein